MNHVQRAAYLKSVRGHFFYENKKKKSFRDKFESHRQSFKTSKHQKKRVCILIVDYKRNNTGQLGSGKSELLNEWVTRPSLANWIVEAHQNSLEVNYLGCKQSSHTLNIFLSS